jgi:acyl dehydratase
MPNPVFVGDTLYAESVILDKRESKSRPYGGIVTAKTRGINQDGKTVIQWKRTFFVYKSDAPQDKGWFPETEINIEDFEI